MDYPGQCVHGDLEKYMRGKDIWVYDDTCTDDLIDLRK